MSYFCSDPRPTSIAVAGGVHVGDNDQNSTLSFALPWIAPGAFHRGMFLPSLPLILEVNRSPVLSRKKSLFCTDEERKDERNRGALSQAREMMAAEEAFVAYDAHVGDSDQNNTLCFGVPSLAPGALHRGRHLRSLEMILEGKISPGSVRSAVCLDWKDDRNWAAGLAAQEAGGKQEELLPPRQVVIGVKSAQILG